MQQKIYDLLQAEIEDKRANPEQLDNILASVPIMTVTNNYSTYESSSTANPKVKHCGGFQQLAQVKRQKLCDSFLVKMG